MEKCASEPDLTAVNVSTSMICLSENEKKELEKTTDRLFNNFTKKWHAQFPELNEGEMQYILLSILNLKKAALLGLSYQGCISRRNRVMNKTGINNLHDDLRNALKNIM